MKDKSWKLNFYKRKTKTKRISIYFYFMVFLFLWNCFIVTKKFIENYYFKVIDWKEIYSNYEKLSLDYFCKIIVKCKLEIC